MRHLAIIAAKWSFVGVGLQMLWPPHFSARTALATRTPWCETLQSVTSIHAPFSIRQRG
jgi:hypothetical protein